jgi:hypothetical protein
MSLFSWLISQVQRENLDWLVSFFILFFELIFFFIVILRLWISWKLALVKKFQSSFYSVIPFSLHVIRIHPIYPGWLEPPFFKWIFFLILSSNIDCLQIELHEFFFNYLLHMGLSWPHNPCREFYCLTNVGSSQSNMLPS